jgi:hypothetical protein
MIEQFLESNRRLSEELTFISDDPNHCRPQVYYLFGVPIVKAAKIVKQQDELLADLRFVLNQTLLLEHLQDYEALQKLRRKYLGKDSL